MPPSPELPVREPFPADGIIYDLYMKQYGKVRYPKVEPVVA